MPDIFDYLRRIEKSPEAYLVHTNSKRELQLYGLMIVIIGYTDALRAHDIDEPLKSFTGSFGQYLRKRFGWSMSEGPIGAILAQSPNADAAWDSFWPLLWDFERSLRPD